MCGIAGLWSATSTLDPLPAVERMTAAMVHRGPDDGGVEEIAIPGTGRLVLGNRRLAIIDCSPAGHQPMRDPQTGNTIVFNGEIFNFQEIRTELQTYGYTFGSNSDTEVILTAYHHYGEKCVDYFRGMFAFAIYDALRNQLVLARDRLGIKPLYYAHTPAGHFLFASELRALLASGLITRQLSPAGLQSYLALGAVWEPWTIVEGVVMFPAATIGRYTAGELSLQQYWSLPPASTNSYRSRAEVTATLRELVRQAVKLRLIADVPLGAFLSGGLDSSSIVALMAQASNQPPHTVSVIFQEQEFSEAPFAQRVAAHCGAHHHNVSLTAPDLLNMIPQALAAMDQPTFDGINTYVVSQATRAAGLTVALSGLGGDELFGGYPSFHWAPLLTRIVTLPLPLRRSMSRLFAAPLSRQSSGQKLRRWLMEDDCEPNSYFLLRGLFSPAVQVDLFSQSNDALWKFPIASIRGPRDVALAELSHYMRNVLLRDTDVMSMAHSLEVRTPFLDHKLVEFVLSLPPALVFSGKGAKPLLAQAMAPLLPPETRQRQKQGFVLPFARWLTGPLHQEVASRLLDRDQEIYRASILNRDAVAQVSTFLHGRTSWVRPWALYVLLSWMEMNNG